MAQQIFAGGKTRTPSRLVAVRKKRATQRPAKRSSQTAKVISEQCLSSKEDFDMGEGEPAPLLVIRQTRMAGSPFLIVHSR